MNDDQRIFVSYRREDTGQVVGRFVEALTGLLGNERVFADSESLRGGEKWQERLQEEVDRCTVLFALIGGGWLTAHNAKSGVRRLDEPDDWVRHELEWALARPGCRVISVLVDSAQVPDRSYLPESIGALPERQASLLRTSRNRDWQADFKQLLIDAGLQAGAPAPAPAQPSADACLVFRISKGTITCRAMGEPELTEPFVALESGTQPLRDLAKIENNTCVADDIRNLGRELWQRLRPGTIEPLVQRVLARERDARRVVELRLATERELEGLPWEVIDDENDDCLSIAPTMSVSRLPFLETGKPNVRAELEGGKLRVIVVIPTGSGLQSCIELQKIRETLDTTPGVELALLEGRVTPQVLADEMKAQRWDIVHFIGHGRHDTEEQQFRVRLNAAPEPGQSEPPPSEFWMPADTFVKTLIRAEPQIVVLNCCGSAGMEDFGNSMGSSFLKRGVPAAVVMRYQIRDDAAAEFSRAFYRELLASPRVGDVGLAVQEGRAALQRSFSDRQRIRSHVTPVLYLAGGCRRLLRGLKPPEAGKRPKVALPARTESLPDALLNAMKAGCCLPILGPGILTVDAVRRDGTSPLDPHMLGRKVAERSGFPDLDRLHPLAENSAQWLVPLLFPRYCHHFENMQGSGPLSEIIRKAYQDLPAPEVVQHIASWNVPGFAYTHLDGLLESALIEHGRKPRLLRPSDLKRGEKPTPGTLSLLTLRGHLGSTDSMVLTEYDEDLILDAAGEIAACLEDLMRLNSNTSLLFLGVSPRDPIVRALARRLLREETRRSRGMAYFVTSTVSPADRAYWKFLDFHWLTEPIDTVIRGLTAVGARTGEDASQ